MFHEVALRLQQMLTSHSYRIEEVIKLVNEDTALASEMLKQANSCYNAGKAPITTIKSAIVRLGSQQIVNLAFSASLANNNSENPLIARFLAQLWQHSHIVAITSSWLAVEACHRQRLANLNPDEVYLAGLFHDIGKLFLLKAMDNLIQVGIMKADTEMIESILNDLATMMGVRLINYWKIPEIYADSIERHNADSWRSGTNDYLVAAVRLSCKIHHCLDSNSDLTDLDKRLPMFSEESFLLGIDDIEYLFDLEKSIID